MTDPVAPETAPAQWPLPGSGTRLRKDAARGMLLLTVSNALYIASGYAITVWLARHLGPRDFGRYGVVTAIVTLVGIAVTRGVPVAATRAIAEQPGDSRRTMITAARVTVPLVLAVGVLAAAAAVPIASALGDERLRVPLVVGAGAAVTYALQALPMAWFTGMHRYGWQAFAQAWYAVSRLVAIIAGGLLAGLSGAIGGFVLAPAVAALATVGVLGALRRDTLPPRERSSSRKSPAVTGRALLSASVPLVGIAALVSVLLTIDILAFKRVADDSDVGRYLAAATIAHVPFFLLRSAPIVLMPAVAAAAAATTGIDQRGALVRNEVRSGIADAIVLLALPTAFLVTLGDRALEILFSDRYGVDGLVVAPLALATAAITLFTVLVAVEIALGTLRVALATGLAGSAAVAAAAAIGGQGSNPSRAAWAVALAATATLLVHSVSLRARIGPFVAGRALAAVAVAGVVGALALATPAGTWWLAVSATAGCVAYAAVVLRAGLIRLR
jgi:O-antigen/teichoic acid export membrane protein